MWKHCWRGFIWMSLHSISSTDSKVRTPYQKKIVPSENTAEEVSFECSHHWISSTHSKVRTTPKTPSFTLVVKRLIQLIWCGWIYVVVSFFRWSVIWLSMCLLYLELSPTLASKWLASETHGLPHCKLKVSLVSFILYIYFFHSFTYMFAFYASTK